MSGICGLWSFDGQDADLGPIIGLLERRGPDGTNDWANGPVALGHTLLATTPEALVETLPLTDPASGCTITADVRLDNRDELIAALGLVGEVRTIGDGELILRAYLEWGADCPGHLLGDFAFAIWDPRVDHLFCARDHMGMRQLIYHYRPGAIFAFATEADALVAHNAVPRTIDEGRIADYLDRLEGIDFTSTFFEAVVRLPPAHTLTVDAHRCTLHRYWTLAPGPELNLASDGAYVAAFLALFTDAVRCRLRSAGPVGSMLSGGLDSNSVAAVAGQLLTSEGLGPLTTFSAIGAAGVDCAESASIRTATASPMFDSRLVFSDDAADAADEIKRLTEDCAEPWDGPMVLIAAVYRLASKSGAKIVLDGVAADITLTAGNRVSSLLKQGKIRTAMREARAEADYWGPAWPLRTILPTSAWNAAVPAWARQWRRRLIWTYRDHIMAKGHDSLSKDLAAKVDHKRRRTSFRRHLNFVPVTSREFRRQAIVHPHLVVARERYDRIAARLAIEPRDPFMDIRLINFCLSLPDSQLQANGFPKLILRRAMEGLVPSNVIWKRGKDHLGWAFVSTVLWAWPQSRDALIEDRRLLSWLGRGRCASAATGVDTEDWFRLTVLSEWLRRQVSDA